MTEEEIVRAADVLDDIHRLPFVGFALDIEHAPAVGQLRARITLSGGGQPEFIGEALTWPDDADSMADASRKLPLIEAVLDFLNAGGDASYLQELLPQMQALPQINYASFRFMTAMEFKDRELFFLDAMQQIVRVVPGLYAEVISSEAFAALQDPDGEEPDNGRGPTCDTDSSAI